MLGKIKELVKNCPNDIVLGEAVRHLITEDERTREELKKRKDFPCYEIWRPNIPDNGCSTQCTECKNAELREKNLG